MKKMSYERYMQIKKWMMQHARSLEMTLWTCLFEEGSKETVVRILETYQNEDGGFGQGLEPDNWNPVSTPVATVFALNVLERIGYGERTAPIYQGIEKYILSGKDREDYGWKFTIETNENYPHAPWWNYSKESNQKEYKGITGTFAGFLLQSTERESEAYQLGMKYAQQLAASMREEEQPDDIAIGGYMALYNALKKTNITEFDEQVLASRLKEMVRGSIVQDTNRWESYVPRPSEYIKSPESLFYLEHRDIVDKELDYLIETLPQDDVWPITWSWFGNGEKYANAFAISEVWWKAIKAIEKIEFLRAFGRIEFK